MPLIIQNGTGISPIWFPDWMQYPFNIGIQSSVTQTATFNVEHTFDNIDVPSIGPFSGNANTTIAANATWIANPGISSATTNLNGNYAYPVRAIRVNVLSSSLNGIVAVTFVQAGVGDFILTGAGLPFVTNLKASNISNFRTAYRANTGNVPIAFHGNSTIRGVDEGALPYNSQYNLYDIPYQLSNALNAAGIIAGAENWFGLSGTTLTDYIIRDSRWSVSGGTVTGTEKLQGGTAMQFPNVTSGATFVTASNVDKFDLYWQDLGASNRIFSYTIDGGSAVNVTTTGTSIMKKISAISLGSNGVHTIAFNWVSGGTTLFFGIDAYDSSRNQISIWQQGISGGTSANMIDNTGTPAGGRITQLTQFPPKLIFTEMGMINDARTSIPVATFQANCISFVNSMKAINVDVIFVVPPWDNATGTGNVANQNQYTAAMYAAAATADVPIADIRILWPSYAYAVANGYQRSTDNVHPSTAGYQYLAYNMFLQIINQIK